MGVDFQSPLTKNNNMFGFITSHGINSSKSGLCLNQLAKYVPMSGDLINTHKRSLFGGQKINMASDCTILKIFDTHE